MPVATRFLLSLTIFEAVRPRESREAEADIVAMSALLLTTMPEMKVVIEKLENANIRSKVIVGGRPVTQEFADEIGPDA